MREKKLIVKNQRVLSRNVKPCVVAISILALQGCVWSGYLVRPDGHTLYGTPPGPVASLQNINNPTFKTNAIDALETAAQVIQHPDFEASLKTREFRMSCDSDVLVKGSAVIDDLRRAFDFSLVARKPFRAIAVTDIANQRMAIKKSRFQGWNGDVEARAEMIETLVHEMTHLVPERGFTGDPINARHLYKDDGHGSPSCPDNQLVSYELGRIAGEVYKLNHEVFDQHPS